MIHRILQPLHGRHDPSAVDELPDEVLDARGAGQVGEGSDLGLGQEPGRFRVAGKYLKI